MAFERKQITTDVPPDYVERLERIAGAKMVSRSSVVRWAIEEFLARNAPSGSNDWNNGQTIVPERRVAEPAQ
jgi:predicted transcriptional regulator